MNRRERIRRYSICLRCEFYNNENDTCKVGKNCPEVYRPYINLDCDYFKKQKRER